MKHWEVTLGKITQLAVAWKEPVVLSKAEAVPMARDGLILVKVEETKFITVAELTLKDLGGKRKDWQLWLPRDAVVKVTPPEGVPVSLLPPTNKNEPVQIRKLLLDNPTQEPIKVTVTVTADRATGRAVIGPFSVIEALRQEGTIEVRATAGGRARCPAELPPLRRFRTTKRAKGFGGD